jgi:hypothetical protein
MLEFTSVKPDINGRRQLRLTKDVRAVDSCWNQPRPVELKAGDVLTAKSREATSCGDFFFSVNDTCISAMLPDKVFKTRCPYDSGVYNPEFLTEV